MRLYVKKWTIRIDFVVAATGALSFKRRVNIVGKI